MIPKRDNRHDFAAFILLILVGCTAEADSGSGDFVVDGGNSPAASFGDAETDTQPESAGGNETKAPAAPSQLRKFRFNYAFTLTGLEPGQRLRVWLPVPRSSEFQTVKALGHRLPGEPTFHTEPKCGNRILYFEAVANADGKVTVDVPYEIERRAVSVIGGSAQASTAILPEVRKLFLAPNRRVPVAGKPLELLQGLPLAEDLFRWGRQLFDVVDGHVAYNKKGIGWGRGDVLWVCDSGRGNCSDFHSLFISLARSQGLPAKFEIGFPLPPDAAEGAIAGYHCWAWFHVEGRGWIPVDISEADKHPEQRDDYFGKLTADRVTFTVGRDLTLAPPQAGPPLNFFVYPYVETDGKPLPSKQIELRFSYADIP